MNPLNILKSIEIHWFHREQTVKECAKQLYDFLEQLEHHNKELFGSLSMDSDEQLINTLDQKGLESILKTSTDLQSITFDVRLWNEHMTITVEIGNGAYSIIPNVVIIEFESSSEFYQNRDNQGQLIELMNSFWQPQQYQTTFFREFPSICQS